MKNSFILMCIFLSFFILSSTNLNAQFLENTETVDIVQIPGFDDGGKIPQYYVADLGTETDSIVWATETGDVTKWYKIPAGGVSDGTADVQAYFYKNVATGRYLYISDEILSQLAGDDGDWPTKMAEAIDVNGKTAAFKWFNRAANPDWPWAIYLTNASGINLTKRDGNRYNSLTGIILMKINESGGAIDLTKEFFGVYVPHVSVGGFAGGLGNVWAVVKNPVVVETGVLNPDVPHFLNNTKTVNIVQITTWMAPNNAKLGGAQPFATDSDGKVVYSIDASAETTKWYEIPAGGNEFGQQMYFYKNVVSGAYLKGSTRVPGEGGDWTVSEAVTSMTNDNSNLFKWSKMDSNWGNGPWLVNEEGNTGARPSGDNKNAFFALTMLTANSEFFGVDVPNVAISNPHDGGNAWTAVKINTTATAVANPDYRFDNAKTVNVVQISTWMTPNNAKLGGAQPFASDSEGKVVYSTDATAETTKWYEIPAGAGTYGQQVYFYKNVATGAYIQGSTRTPGEGGDWTVSEAVTSMTNDNSNLFKWSKMDSNWGNGPWLVNEDGNTGARPSGDNKNAFFALTMLTANSEFFGVDVPNVAISNPHDGGNAWTAVKLNVLESATNPDYQPDGSFGYSIEALNFFATDDGEDNNASSYNEETNTITFKNGGWHRAGWNWEAEGGIDVSAYNQVWIKFDASALPKTGDGEGGATKLQFDVVYMDDSNTAEFDNKSNEIRSNATEYFYNLTPGKKIKRITLKSEVEGDLVLTDAYFFSKGIDPVDLVVTNISWSPENPVLGNSILLSATIKNQSEFASQNVKHGVIFGIKLQGAAGNGTLIGWSDTHLTALAPGESVTVTINGGPNDTDGTWRPGAAKTFTIVAQVNDQKDVLESDYSNNIMEKDVVVAIPPVDLIVTNISWTPAEPVLGDQIKFSATIKNQSEYTSQNVKHGVAFSIAGTVVAWSDTHVKGMAPGEEITLTANGGPANSNGAWTPALSKTFTVKAEVNDQHEVVESDYNNNSLEMDITVDNKNGIDEMVSEGKVFVRDGSVHLINFSENAVVTIYNVQAQKIGDFLPNEVSQLTLQKNLYVLKVLDRGKISNHKVLVK